MARDFRYCPKCGYKKLIRRYNYKTGYYIWVCEHNKKTWGSNPPKGPQCNCRIEVADRSAKIADFGTVLDQINRAGEPEIKTWLLENDKHIHRRGLEVLYEGELVDVVRLRDGGGVAAYIYYKEARKNTRPGERKQLRDFRILRQEAANHIFFRSVPLRAFVLEGCRYRVWNKSGNPRFGFDPLPFSGNLGKKKKAEIVEWAKEFEKEMPALRRKAKKETERWLHEQKKLSHELDGSSVSLSQYSGETRQACINIIGFLTREQILAIAEIVDKKSS